MMRLSQLLAAILSLFLLGPGAGTYAEDLPDRVILFKNVNIFDGKSDQLIKGRDVLVVRNKIHKIAKEIPTGGTYEVQVTSGGERKVKVLSDFAPSVYEITVMEAPTRSISALSFN